MRSFLLLLLALLLVLPTPSPAQRNSKGSRRKNAKDLVSYDVSTEITTAAPKRKMSLADKLERVTKEQFSPKALNEDFTKIMGAHFNWEELLSPAPFGISILAELIVLSAGMSDFPLNEFADENFKFEHMKYPGSFRASLVHISNIGYKAFNLAHTNMDKIRLFSYNVPQYLKDAMRILMSRKPKVVALLLPEALERIKLVAVRCVTLSREVVDHFEGVMALTDEVVEATTATKGLKEQQREQEQAKLKSLNATVENLNATMGKIEKENSDTKADIEKLTKQFEQAQNEMPSGWKIIGMNALENFCDLFTLRLGKSLSSASENKNSQDGEATNLSEDDAECLINGRQALIEIHKMAAELERFSRSNFKVKAAAAKMLNATVEHSKLENVWLQNLHCKPIEQVCDQGKDVLQDVQTLLSFRQTKATLSATVTANHTSSTNSTTNNNNESGNADTTPPSEEELQQKVQQFVKSVDTVHKLALSIGAPAANKNPFLKDETPTGASASAYEVQRARLKVLLAHEQLNAAHARHEKMKARVAATNALLIDKLAELSQSSTKEINYKDAIKLLKDGLAILTQIKEHWTNLVRYFQLIATVIETRLSDDLNQFRNYTEIGGTHQELFTEVVYLSTTYVVALRASQAAYYVHGMADTYTKISAQYLLPQLAKLNQLITFDANTATPKMLQLREELREAGETGSKAVMALVAEERQQVMAGLQSRVQNLEEQFSFVLLEGQTEAEETEAQEDLDDYI